MTVPTPPPVPTSWTVPNIVAYVAGLAVFIFGVLVACGVVFPASVAGDVQIIVGAITSVVGTFSTQIPLILRSSLQKAALKQGHPVAEAQLL